MADAAQRHQEVLIRHGMDESVLAGLVQALADLQAADDGCQAGRNAHVGATAGLHAVRQEILELVRVLDGLNRNRLQDDEVLLAQWFSVSSVRAAAKAPPAEEPAPGPAAEIPPAGAPTPPAEVTRPAA